jgi:Na+-transporting methylmalonyl-CoA/oxaloacetate decarboxylase gamma subunit
VIVFLLCVFVAFIFIVFVVHFMSAASHEVTSRERECPEHVAPMPSTI